MVCVVCCVVYIHLVGDFFGGPYLFTYDTVMSNKVSYVFVYLNFPEEGMYVCMYELLSLIREAVHQYDVVCAADWCQHCKW